MVLLPSLTSIQHLVWTPVVDGGGNPVKDAHGNPTGAFAAPVQRMIVCWFPLARRLWQIDPVSPNVEARIDNDIHMLVEDSTVYNKLDRVVVDGLIYQVEGLPMDWSDGLPFANMSYSMLVGGEVHCRRVTSTGVLAGQ
jgi:hypothetical protein